MGMSEAAINTVIGENIDAHLRNLHLVKGNKQDSLAYSLAVSTGRLREEQKSFTFRINEVGSNLSLIICHNSVKDEVYKFDLVLVAPWGFSGGWVKKSAEFSCPEPDLKQ